MGITSNRNNSSLIETLYEEPGVFVKLRYDEELKVHTLHIDIADWSKSEFKRYLKIFNMLCNDLKKRGIKEIYGLCENPKAVKFNKMFGYEVTNTLAEIDDGSYRIIVKKEL